LFILRPKSRQRLLPLSSLPANYGIRIVTLAVTVASVILFFELIPKRGVWSIPVQQGDEHMLAVPGSGGFSEVLIRKQGAEEHKAATAEEEHKKQYHGRTRILIIDDESDITLTFRKALSDKGFEELETVNDPILALKNFKPGSYDLLIIDIVMSEMDGFSLYEEIRKIDNKVKVCFITAFGMNYQALRDVLPAVTTTDDIGCFIRKPVDMDDLVKRIKGEMQ
jgi:CheY-like chemotaxis protein